MLWVMLCYLVLCAISYYVIFFLCLMLLMCYVSCVVISYTAFVICYVILLFYVELNMGNLILKYLYTLMSATSSIKIKSY